jgi:hypothetical protein
MERNFDWICNQVDTELQMLIQQLEESRAKKIAAGKITKGPVRRKKKKNWVDPDSVTSYLILNTFILTMLLSYCLACYSGRYRWMRT